MTPAKNRAIPMFCGRSLQLRRVCDRYWVADARHSRLRRRVPTNFPKPSALCRRNQETMQTISLTRFPFYFFTGRYKGV